MKCDIFKRIISGTAAAAVTVSLAGSVPAFAAEEDSALTITGTPHSNGTQVDYVIPQDAPKTVVLDGRDMMDFLIQRGDYNEMYPGTWTGGWLTLRNQSGYSYRVTDISFTLDHTQTKENSRILKDLPYNPYEIGRNFHGTSRPDEIKARNTGAIGFDGYAIPGSMTILRSKSSAVGSYFDTKYPRLSHVVGIDELLQAEGKSYSDLLVEYYQNAPEFAPITQNVTDFDSLPLYCFTDSLCDPSYDLWNIADPTGQDRWKIGDIRLEGRFFVKKSADDPLRYPVMLDIYDKYDENGTPHYYYVDKNEFGEDAAGVEVDLTSETFDYISGGGFMTNNNYFGSKETGDMTGIEADNYWYDENRKEYFVLEADPKVVQKGYDTFYSDMLSFTFDSKKYPLPKGRQDVSTFVGGEPGELSYSEYTEGSAGMHYADYMAKNPVAKEVMDNTVGSWILSPAGTEGDWNYSYTNLKLSGQNTPNNYAGTELMRGLTLQVTLERVESSYTIEYYKDSVDSKNLIGSQAYSADLNATVAFPQELLNSYLPEQGGYDDGVLQSDAQIVIQQDASKNVFQVLYTRDPYQVYYDANGGTGTQTDLQNPYFPDDSVTVLGQGEITRIGYEFLGWNTAPDGSGVSYDEKDVFRMPKVDVTLYAQWAEDTEEIPDENPPLVPPEEDIPDDDVPLAGDSTSTAAASALALAAASAAILTGGKKRKKK